MEFDALEGILGFSLEEIPKEDIYIQHLDIRYYQENYLQQIQM